MDDVRHNLTATRSFVSCMDSTADMILLQIFRPRTMEDKLEIGKKYDSLVHISKSPQTNINIRKESVEQSAECLNDISIAI